MRAFDCAGVRASLCDHLVAVPSVNNHLLGGEAVAKNIVLTKGSVHGVSRVVFGDEVHVAKFVTLVSSAGE